jgi:hypothetical protein
VGREVRVRRYPAGPVTTGDFEVVEAMIAGRTVGKTLVSIG